MNDLANQIDPLTRDTIRACLGMHAEEDIDKVPTSVLEIFAKASGMAHRLNGVNFSAGEVILATILAGELTKLSERSRAPAAVTHKPVRGDTLTDADWRELPIEAALIVHYAGEQRDAKLLGKTARKVRVAIIGDDRPFREVDASKVIVMRQDVGDG